MKIDFVNIVCPKCGTESKNLKIKYENPYKNITLLSKDSEKNIIRQIIICAYVDCPKCKCIIYI